MVIGLSNLGLGSRGSDPKDVIVLSVLNHGGSIRKKEMESDVVGREGKNMKKVREIII